MKLQRSGQAVISREVKHEGRVVEELGGIKTGGQTVPIAPFTTDEVHAVVAGDMSVTLSESYQSVRVGVHVQIPVPPTADGVNEGLTWCFEKCGEFLNKEAEGARKALRHLAGQRG